MDIMLTLVTNVSLSYMLGKGSESSSLSFFSNILPFPLRGSNSLILSGRLLSQ